MEDCIFCKIVKGEIPCHKIYENSEFLSFLDINPLNPGHTLVIPKKHYRLVWDVPNGKEYFEVVKKIAKVLQKSMKTEWVFCAVAGTEIPHSHIHLIPRFENDGHEEFVKWNAVKKLSKEEMENIAEKIRNAF